MHLRDRESLGLSAWITPSSLFFRDKNLLVARELTLSHLAAANRAIKVAAEMNVSCSLQVGAGRVTLPFLFSA